MRSATTEAMPADLNPATENVSIPALPTHRGRAGDRWVFAALWLLAMGYVALTATNYHAVAVASDRLEGLLRHAPSNVVGRGATEAFEATQPPAQFDPDSHCWINLTQRQWREGTVRPHDFPFDNTPYGRERHWSQSFSWWLLILGGITHVATGMPMEAAIAQAATPANPVLFVLFLTATGLILRRRLDAWPTGVFLVTLASCWGVEWDFSYGRPDHHGLHLIAYVGLMLAALIAGLGWVRREPDSAAESEDGAMAFLVRPATWRHARFWFTVSGLCGGMGLWIGSTQQCFCIAVLGIGAVLGVLCFARPDAESRFAPELWRHWARVGAGTSLAFYLIEYFPSHMEMRLEVNHPLMSLGWLGAGELMWVIMVARLDGPRVRERGRELLTHGMLGLVAVSGLPAAIAFGPKAWWVIGDPIMARSASVISEGQAWLDPHKPAAALQSVWDYTGVLLLALPLAAGLLIFRRQLPAWRRTAMLTGIVASVVFLGWTLLQNRWMGFLETSLAMLALLAAPCLPRWRMGRGTALPLGLLALTVPGWAGFALLQTDTYAANPLVDAHAMLKGMMALKEVAWNLRLDAPEGAVARVICPPGDSPVLHYYDNDVQTVGSFYWENLRAVHAVVDFYTDQGDAVARRIARERGIDFVIAVTQPSFVLQMQIYDTGHTDAHTAPRTLAYRLANPTHAQPPDWLELVPLADAPVAAKEGFRIYRVRRDKL